MRRLTTVVCSTFALLSCLDAPGPRSMQAMDGGTDTVVEGPNYHDDVAPILAHRCLRCHRGGNLGAVPLTEYEEVGPLAALIANEVTSGDMPPFRADASGACNEYDSDLVMTKAEVELLSEWARSGAPEGPDREPPRPTLAPDLSGERVELQRKVYRPDPSESRDYRCFPFESDVVEGKFLTGLQGFPATDGGGQSALHHAILYAVEEERVAVVEALDEADAGDGYECYGGPGVPFPAMLGVWTPGQGAVRFPEDTGIRLPSGSKVVLQAQFDTTVQTGLDELIDFDLAVADEVEREAFLVAVGDTNMALPSGRDAVDTTNDIRHPYFPYVEKAGHRLHAAGLTVHGILPHMHTRGQQIEVQHFARKTGDGRCMVRVPEWDFDWQRFYFFKRPFVSEPGDFFRIRCSYDTRGRQTYVGWGDDADEEMCAAFAYVTAWRPTDGTPSLTEVSEKAELHDGSSEVGAQPASVAGRQIGASLADLIWMLTLEDDGSAWAAMLVEEPGREPTTMAMKLGEDLEPQQRITLEPTSKHDRIRSIDVLSDGAVLIGGTYDGTPTLAGDGRLPPTVGTDSDGAYDSFLALFEPGAAGAPRWLRTISGGGRTGMTGTPGSVVVDESHDRIAMLAFSDTTGIGFSGESLGLESAARATPIVLALDYDHDDPDAVPTVAWAHPFVGQGPFEHVGAFVPVDLYGIDIDSEGNVYFVGAFAGSLQTPAGPVPSRGFDDGLLGKLSPDGTLQWLRLIGARQRDRLRAVVVGDDDVIHVAGIVVGPAEVRSATGETLDAPDDTTIGGGRDGLLMRWSSDGELLWSEQIGGPHHEMFYDMALAEDGSYVVATQYFGAGTLDGSTPLEDRGVRDVGFASFAADGTLQFAVTRGSRGQDQSRRIALNGDRILLGWSIMSPSELSPGVRFESFELTGGE